MVNTRRKLKKIHDLLLEHFGPQHWWPGDTDFEVCVGAILTQNTNWQNVEKAINNLKAQKTLTPKALFNLPERELVKLIKPSGYFNIKAKRLRHFLQFLMDRHQGSLKKAFSGKMDQVRNRLLEINGIGPETADSMLLYAAGFPIFVIDAYTKRIFHRLGYCAQEISYHELQCLFMEHLPSDTELYNEYHALLVMLGKYHCKPKPLCHECPCKKICGIVAPQGSATMEPADEKCVKKNL